MSTIARLSAKALVAHPAHLNFTPSTLARRGSQTSLSSSSSSMDQTSHDHLFHSLHLHSRLTHWREQIWTHHTDRSERIALGYLALGSKVLTTEEMEVEIGCIPEVTRGFRDCLPVAGAMGGFVGWRVKGATFPRSLDA